MSDYKSSMPYESPNVVTQATSSSSTLDVTVVISSQRLLIFAILGYLCSMPIMLLANAFLAGTPDKPVATVSFGLVLVFGLLCMFAASCCACIGIFRMGRVLFPGSTRVIYAIGVLVPAPLVGLLVMFVASAKATGYLKANGIEVGFFGAKANTLSRE